MRGTAVNCKELTAEQRITPAHAGNSARATMASGLFQDHPRSCGEQLSSEVEEIFQVGSPPLMRGTGIPSSVAKPVPRIIPAHAGNSGI